MGLGDMITVGIVVFVGLMLLLGSFKWLLKLSNIILAVALVIVVLMLLARCDLFSRLTRGIFSDAVLLQTTSRMCDDVVQNAQASEEPNEVTASFWERSLLPAFGRCDRRTDTNSVLVKSLLDRR